MHKDVAAGRSRADAAERPSPDHLEHLGQHEVPSTPSSTRCRSTSASRRPLCRPAARPLRHRSRHGGRHGPEPAPATAVRTPSSTAWPRRSGPGHVEISARRDGDKRCCRCGTMASGVTEDALTVLQKARPLDDAGAAQHLYGRTIASNSSLPQGLAVVVACRGGRRRRSEQRWAPETDSQGLQPVFNGQCRRPRAPVTSKP